MPHVTSIARTDGDLVDFAPYVPAIDDNGSVAFQAVLANGSHAILLARNDTLETVATAGSRFSAFVSHPDIDETGAICWYAIDAEGNSALVRWQDGEPSAIVGAELGAIGPLGPTASAGWIGFRANLPDGRPGVFLWSGTELIRVAAAGGEIIGFQGLPVVAGGSVLFRSDLVEGGSAIDLWRDGEVERIAQTGQRWADLGRFPTLTPHGIVAFVATTADGSQGLFSGKPGEIEALPLDASRFESLRGGLITDAGQFCDYGTPVNGSLGIYVGRAEEPVLAIGAAFEGSSITDFALNPVSINRHGQIVVRLSLEDGGQAIVRIDPD